MLREELLSGPGEADNIQRGCSTISMAVNVHMSLEVSTQEKVRSKRWLDGCMRRTWQCSAQSNRWVTAHLHSIMTPTRASYLPVPPFPCSSAKFFDPVPPARLRRKQPCSKAEDKSGLSSSTAAVRTWPAGRQGIVSAQLFGKLNERCWDRSHNRPVDIHHGLDAVFPEDGASHEGQASASVVKERELGRRPELYGETSRKVNALLCVKKTTLFFSTENF